MHGTASIATIRLSGVDPSYLFDALEEHQQSTQEFLLANGFDSTLEAIVGGKAILPGDATVLAASLPYRVLVRGSSGGPAGGAASRRDAQGLQLDF